MRIGLIDVDSHNFPNLALMKIASYHKAKKHHVEFVNLFSKYDVVYKSKIFDFTKDFDYFVDTEQLLEGGTGYNLKNKLQDEIESSYPNYTLYNITDTAYGFLTRGCPRKCLFCIVSEKEGCKSTQVADLKQFWKNQKHIKLLDPNLLASENHLGLLQQLIDSKAYVDFTQGLDCRLLTEKNISKLKDVKVKTIHFAWDNMRDEKTIVKNLNLFKSKTKLNYRKLKVYVLTNFNTTFEEDLYRVYKLVDLGYDPYIMIFEKWKCEKKYKQLQRWVNNKIIFRSTKSFREYLNYKGG